MYRLRPTSFRGFTLIELSVSMAIIAGVTFSLLSKYPETAVRLTLVNVSQTISLLVREAQVRGSAVDSLNGAVGGYGVYASLSSPDRITLFGDMVEIGVPKPNGIEVGDTLYETTPLDETRSVSVFPNKYVIHKLCLGTGFPFSCNSVNVPSIDSLTISFTRPNPSPAIYINNATSTSYTAACIEVRSPQAPSAGHVRSIQVYNSGMITTVPGKCDNDPS